MGNGNVPLQTMYEEFSLILEETYGRLNTCTGNDGQGCETGCYRCLRSYGLQRIAHQVDKGVALMFAGYLTGKNRFLPAVELPKATCSHYDLVFKLSLRGNEITLQANRLYQSQVNGSQNRAIFELMSQAVQSEFQEGMKSLLVRAKLDYLVNAIEKGEIKNDREDFARLQFHLLRFQHIKAEKG
jgi:hypothetical protein